MTPDELKAELESVRAGWGRREWIRQDERLRPVEYQEVTVKIVKTPVIHESEEGPS